MMVPGSSYEEWNYSSYMEQRDYLGNRTLKFQTLNQKKVKREKKIKATSAFTGILSTTTEKNIYKYYKIFKILGPLTKAN